jgi:hypothetical protein
VRPGASTVQKVKDMRKLFKQLCAQLCPDSQSDRYCPPEREQEAIEKIMRDIGQTMRYADPQIIRSSRPQGLIGSSQKEQLEGKAASCGYSPAVLQHLLLNRLGKPSTDVLTKAEAALFLSYMKSPGALL